MSFTYKRVSSDEELQQILTIQKRNIKSNLSETEMENEGFVTVDHDFNTLKKLNEACAHIIVKDRNIVSGYALTMLPTFKYEIPLLTPMFSSANKLIGRTNYLAMGQICIDKPYRKKGLFKGMYSFYKQELQHEYDCLITEVATNNVRSLEAHKKVGFKILKTRITNGVSWELLHWEWR